MANTTNFGWNPGAAFSGMQNPWDQLGSLGGWLGQAPQELLRRWQMPATPGGGAGGGPNFAYGLPGSIQPEGRPQAGPQQIGPLGGGSPAPGGMPPPNLGGLGQPPSGYGVQPPGGGMGGTPRPLLGGAPQMANAESAGLPGGLGTNPGVPAQGSPAGTFPSILSNPQVAANLAMRELQQNGVNEFSPYGQLLKRRIPELVDLLLGRLFAGPSSGSDAVFNNPQGGQQMLNDLVRRAVHGEAVFAGPGELQSLGGSIAAKMGGAAAPGAAPLSSGELAIAEMLNQGTNAADLLAALSGGGQDLAVQQSLRRRLQEYGPTDVAAATTGAFGQQTQEAAGRSAIEVLLQQLTGGGPYRQRRPQYTNLQTAGAAR